MRKEKYWLYDKATESGECRDRVQGLIGRTEWKRTVSAYGEWILEAVGDTAEWAALWALPSWRGVLLDMDIRVIGPVVYRRVLFDHRRLEEEDEHRRHYANPLQINPEDFKDTPLLPEHPYSKVE